MSYIIIISKDLAQELKAVILNADSKSEIH